MFVVRLIGGLLIALGPGQLLLSLLPELGATTRCAIEIAIGVAMIAVGGALWQRRGRVAKKDLPDPTPRREFNLMLGATVAAVELPTAFPYFAFWTS